MKIRKLSIVTALALSLIMILSGFTSYDGIGTVSYDKKQTIGPDAVYMYLQGENSAAGGIVSAHVIDANVTAGTVKPYVYNGLTRKTYTVSSMANILGTEGYKVIGGINGDIFDMASGTPKGAVIHDGILYTGGYQSEYLLSFDGQGKADVTKQQITYTMEYTKYVNGGGTETGAAETEDARTTIGYFNVPHGGGNALHIFNTRYSDTTKTSGTCAEAVLTITSGSRADLKVGGTVEATVTSVSSNTHSTPIKDNQFVLSANNLSSSYGNVSAMVPGSKVTISVSADAGSPINNADEAMGIYHLLAYKGTVYTKDTTLNPRTCIGIKPDGAVVLFVVDGRQSSVSKGMNAVDITSYLMSLGCDTVVNMDGGGSTTMVARDEPGISNSAKVVNSPSDGTLRSVTNGLFFVYTAKDESGASSIAVYPENTLMMPGMSVQLSSYGVNSLYEKASLPSDVSYSVDSDYGSISSSGLFTSAKGAAGEAVITATSGDITGTARVNIVTDITFALNKTSATLGAGESFDFNVTKVLYGKSQVLYKDSLFTWSCSPEIGTVDQNGKFTAVNKVGEFKGTVNLTGGQKSYSIPVTVKSSSQFSDIEKHWAKDYIIALLNEGIVKGMTDTKFEPDSSLTRAQFLMMLSKVSDGENLKVTPTVQFSDVKSGMWYTDCINWGVANGIVNGMGNGKFAPDAKVSREQMCVMISNYFDYKGMEWEKPEAALNFPDKSKISSWAEPSVKKVVGEGIMSGRADGTFDPLGNATRGEAAKIVYLVREVFYYEAN